MSDDDPRAAAGEASPLDVLVVDDDPTIRRLMGMMLGAAGLATEQASSGREGAAKLATRRFDVIVTDIEMPDGDGLELLRMIRRVDLDVPVIMVTGRPDVRSAAKALEYGAFRYMNKPVDFEELLSHIQQGARAHALARLRREAAAATGRADTTTADRAGLEVRFAAALDRLWMAYQPIVTRTGEAFGVEALLRSDEPSMAPPLAIVDAADRLGRTRELGRRLRTLAAEQIGAQGDGLVLFLNLHPEDLLDDELVVADSAPARIASRVVLEITERARLPSSTALGERLVALRAMGFRMAIDDIGAGYSGLTTFTEVIPEVVKLDMALVRGVHDSPIRRRTIQSLCQLCRDSGSLVLAEGVETAEEYASLLDLGCDLFQGYLFGRPARDLPAAPRPSPS
jgi:EAL domain-containing protein (putative c-di-GMP-specific phosphodiesterase class I)